MQHQSRRLKGKRRGRIVCHVEMDLVSSAGARQGQRPGELRLDRAVHVAADDAPAAFTFEPAGLMLHLWNCRSLATHTLYTGAHEGPILYR